MGVTPNSDIYLYHNIPLNNGYTDTFYFKNITEQNHYFFNSDALFHTRLAHLTGYTYQRVNKDKIRVEKPAEGLYGCNYMAFRNTAYGDKWFYAFVTSVEYVNDNVTELTYEIDVMQTYMLDVEMLQCFIEREHSYSDNVGDNVLAEPIDFGNAICSDMHETLEDTTTDHYVAVVASAIDSTGVPTSGKVAGLYSGVSYHSASINNSQQIQKLDQFLADIIDANQQEAVVSVFMMPYDFFTTGELPISIPTAVARPDSFGYRNDDNNERYTPKNKKLLTYPYNYLEIYTGDNSMVYKYELSEIPNYNGIKFTAVGTVCCNPEIALVPLGYNGTNVTVQQDQTIVAEENWDEKIVMSGFPQIAWCIDAYKAWLAQNRTGTGIGLATSAGTLLAGLAATSTGVGAPLGVAGIITGLGGLASQINKLYLGTREPDKVRGNPSGSIDVATNHKRFYTKKMQIRKEIAKCIDDFFTLYGYASNRLAVPPKRNRKYWTYVKTKGATAVGGCPSDSIAKICSIYDNGIRFWWGAEPDKFGHYNLENTPMSELQT